MDNEYVAEWFQYADRDLATAEHLSSNMYPQPLEIICFHCQQAVEKYLKGYLIFRGLAEPPKIHNLFILGDMCKEHDGRFCEVERACNALNRYGVQPRYPNELKVTEYDMQKALEHARQIRDFELLAEVRGEAGQ